MANEFKIKTGLLIGASTNASVTSIKDTSISITTDASSLLVTGKAVYDYVEANEKLQLAAGITGDSPSWTDNLDGTIDISTCTIRLYDNSIYSGNLIEYVMPAQADVSLPYNETSYIVADYNSGTPIYRSTIDVLPINESNLIPILTIFNFNGTLYPLSWGSLGDGITNKMNARFVKTDRFGYESGLLLSETAGLVIDIESGILWYGANHIDLDAMDSSTNDCKFQYHSGGVWTYSAENTYNNAYYDNGTDLVALGNNKFTVNWVYRLVSSTTKALSYVLGSEEYKDITEAAAAKPRSGLPDGMTTNAVLVGRIIIQKDAAASSQIDSAFDHVFGGAATTPTHNSLLELQGGIENEYYHLTSDEHDNLATQYWSLDGSILSPLDDTVNVQLSAIQIGTDAGTVAVIDMDVSSAGAGVEQSYSFNIDGTQIAQVYAEGDGAAGIQEPAFKVLETLYAESSVYFSGIPEVSTNQVLFYNTTTKEVTYASESAISGVTTLVALTDTSIGGTIPDGSVLTYDSGSSKWTYGSITAPAWGSITGSIASQTDLSTWLTDLSTNKLDNTTDTFTGILTVDGSIIVKNITVSEDVGITGDVAIGGSLTVDGSIYSIGTEEIDVSAAFINLNTGLVGTPPSWMQSGIVVERGNQDPYAIIFDEDQDTFRIGISPKDGSLFDDASTQAVATREDDPVEDGIAYWNNTLYRFDTSIHLKYKNGNLYVNNDISIGSQIFAPNLTAASKPALVFWDDTTGEFSHADASTLGYDTSTFISLNDTPNSYDPVDVSPGMAVVVNDSGDGIGFGPRIWREESDEVTLANEDANVLFYQYIELEADAGIATFVDKDVTASSAIGTEETYRFNMDGNTVAEIYAQSNGAGSIQEQKFVSVAPFLAEASVYMSGIPEVSTGYTLYYNPTTDQVTYAEASLGGGGGTNVSFGTVDQVPVMNAAGDDFEYGEWLTFNASVGTLTIHSDTADISRIRMETRDTSAVGNIDLNYNDDKMEIFGPTALGLAFDNVHIGTTYSGITTLLISSASTGHNIMSLYSYDDYIAFNVKDTGEIYCPSIGASSQSKMVYYNTSNGQITYDDAPAGSTTLSALTDVSIGGLGAAQDGSALVYNHAQSIWEYGVAGGGGDYWTLDGSTLVPTDSTVDVKLGEINIDTDAGAVTLVDMDVSSAAIDTEESYAFNIDGSTVAKVWSESDGAGNLQEYGFVVETAQYMGDPNTNGSWRFYPDSNGDLVFEKRISGTWTEKGKFTE